MKTDTATLNDLIEVLEDGKKSMKRPAPK